ncbi:hypothetical protein [Streptosporangium sp. 'caverna']|uniref:hypothetical protein n=1 Tax=Streptosporangium sp. 'caverna' TaxID=2202249 RepID=UPI000D7E6FFA|nr:hypothetical protein [Streptosporangium sp. 'caverna']AWS45206.1 hypothetical protein DKM19_31710 [Streptosporangium sp. 'caverna']
MSTLEDDLRRLMANETEKLRVAPDLVDRVLRSSRRKKTNRVRLTALATAVAVAGAVVPVYLVLGPNSVAVQGFGLGGPVAASETPRPDATGQAVPEPPAIDDFPPTPSPTPDLGDLGDGRAFGRVRVGYLPAGLQWSHWSLDSGDSYTTSWNYDGDKKGFYCVQIFVYEGQAVQEADERVRAYREEKAGRDVTIGDRTGYLLRQWVGEDGLKGTPSLFLGVGEGRTVEVMFSPTFAKRLGGERTVDRELKKIAAGLTATG